MEEMEQRAQHENDVILVVVVVRQQHRVAFTAAQDGNAVAADGWNVSNATGGRQLDLKLLNFDLFRLDLSEEIVGNVIRVRIRRLQADR